MREMGGRNLGKCGNRPVLDGACKMNHGAIRGKHVSMKGPIHRTWILRCKWMHGARSIGTRLIGEQMSAQHQLTHGFLTMIHLSADRLNKGRNQKEMWGCRDGWTRGNGGMVRMGTAKKARSSPPGSCSGESTVQATSFRSYTNTIA